MNLTTADLRLLCTLVHNRSGLVLSDEKAYLLDSRLRPVARRFGLAGAADVAARLRRGADEPLAAAVTEALTTNETSFFRDGHPFRLLRERVLPQLMAPRSGGRRLRLWSAAASTGQEAYSLAIAVQEVPGLGHWDVGILGTDISQQAVERARAGLYTPFEVQRGLTAQQLNEHFLSEPGGWRVKPKLRAAVRFEQHNLLDEFSRLGPFDVVLLRNVLIYFDLPTRRRVLDRIAALVPEDGILILGTSELASDVSERWLALAGAHGFYRRRR